MSRFALGSVQFGLEYGIANESGRVGAEEVRRILSEASEFGIDLLDTAIGYGESESVLGQVGVKAWKVVSKLPAVPDECTDVASWVEAQVAGSIDRLGVDSLYALLLHRPDQLFQKNGTQLFSALKRVKLSGSVEKIGISIYEPDQLARIFDGMHFDIVQAPLNILDRRIVETGWAERLKKNDVELHARSVFLQGLLLMTGSKRPPYFARWKQLLDEWDRWLNEEGYTPIQACLNYAHSVETVDKIVVGVDSVVQLREILACTSTSLKSLPNWPQVIDIELLNPAWWRKI